MDSFTELFAKLAESYPEAESVFGALIAGDMRTATEAMAALEGAPVSDEVKDAAVEALAITSHCFNTTRAMMARLVQGTEPGYKSRILAEAIEL